MPATWMLVTLEARPARSPPRGRAQGDGKRGERNHKGPRESLKSAHPVGVIDHPSFLA